MDRFIPDEPRDEFSSNTEEYELEDTIPRDYEKTSETETLYEHLYETDLDSEFRKIVDAFYKFKRYEGWVGDRSALLIHNAKTVRDPTTKQIYVDYDGKKIRITYKRNASRFLTLGEIKKQSGTYFVRNVLGFADYPSGGIPHQ